MSKINELINRLDALLKQHNPVNYNRLQPPLPDEEIKSYLEKIGIDDDNVFALYKWKNGVDGRRAMLFDSKVALLSLGDVLKYQEMFADDLDENLITLFCSPFDTRLLFNRKAGKNYGKLYIYSVPLLSIDDPYSYFDSIEKMIETNIKSYEAGGFEYNSKDDILISNLKIHHPIIKSLNVNSNFWQ